MKNVLITGGAGFIGSHLALKLKSEGYSVTCFDNLSPQIHGENPDTTSATYNRIKNEVQFVKGDVRDRAALAQALDKTDCVIHLAAETGTGQSMYDISKYCDVNIQGTSLLLEEVAQRKATIKKVIVASSRAVYGEGQYVCREHGNQYPDSRSDAAMKNKRFEHECRMCGQVMDLVPTQEVSPTNPQSIYGITKLSQEQLVLRACQSFGIDAVALRFQNVYGPGQALSNPYTGILSIFSTRSRENKPIAIFEDGLESRDFVYIDDIVQSIFLSMKYQKPGQHVFNVGSGVKTTVNEVVKEILKFFKSDSSVTITGQYRIGDIRHNIADLKSISLELGYKPTVYFEQGLQNFLNWVLTQEKAQDGYEKSLEELRSRGLLK